MLILLGCIPFFGVAQIEEKEPTELVMEEKMPVFPKFKGGEEALLMYLKENLQYPAEAKENKAKGTVLVIFDINEKGDVENSMLAGEDLGHGLSQEALRLVDSTSGMWEAGTIDGIPTRIKLRVPVKFEL